MVGLVQPSPEEIKRQKLLQTWLASDLDHGDNSVGEVQYDYLAESGPTPFLLYHIVKAAYPSRALPETLPLIRLVHLMPGKDFDQIEVSMEIRDRTYAEYEALSYCWGDSAALSPIICNGSRLYITHNLKCALRDLRHSDTSRVLWIDAICINQKHLKERSEQVKVMGDIYRGAKRTVVWLGDKFAGVELAFQLVNRMYDLYFDKLEGDAWDAFSTGQWRPAKDHTSPTRAELSALDLLLTRPWFRRIWVMQEFCLGKDVQVTCGDQETGWLQFFMGSAIALCFIQRRPDLSPAMRVLLQLTMFRYAVSGQSDSVSLDLLRLCSEFRCCLSTDPRDKILGLIGLTDTNLESLNLIDSYSNSPREIYIRLAEFMLRSSSALDILSITRGTTNTEFSKSLPSWVPDWSNDTAAEPFSSLSDIEEESRYDATSQSMTIPPLFSKDNSLTLSGHRLDRLVTLSIVFSKSNFDHGRLQEKKEAIVAYGRNSPSGPIAYLRHSFKFYCLVSGLASFTIYHLTLMALSLDTTVQWNEIALGPANERATDIYTPTGEPLETAYMATSQLHVTPVPESIQEDFRFWWQSCRPTLLLRKWKLNRVPFLYHCVITTMFFIRILTGWKMSRFISLKDSMEDRRLCWTDTGYLGLVHGGACVGDEVWLLKGGKMPFLLRRVDDENEKFELIGECYIHGVMSGEKFEGERCSEVTIV